MSWSLPTVYTIESGQRYTNNQDDGDQGVSGELSELLPDEVQRVCEEFGLPARLEVADHFAFWKPDDAECSP